MASYEEATWDPQAACAAAGRFLEEQDSTGAVTGARETFAQQRWTLSDLKLWWRPAFSPSSHIRALVVAEWTGSGAPRGPQIKVVVYTPDGGLMNIDDISPYWRRSREPIPDKLVYNATIQLVGTGLPSVPGRIEMMAGDVEQSDDENEDDASYYR